MDFKLIEKLVDMTLEKKVCPKGYRWCTKTNKCIPDEQGLKGKGRGLGRGNKRPPGKDRR